MLDGTQLSAIALLWFCLSSIKKNRSTKFNFLGAGFACSFMLLLKAPCNYSCTICIFITFNLGI